MNCANHPELQAVAYCRECGKPMCADCQRPALGSIYCAEHAPVTATAIPELPPPVPQDYKARDYRTFAEAPTTEPSFLPPPPPPPHNPYTAAEPVVVPPAGNPNSHPLLALFLGFIPGVGAIYNGQYAKGLIHAVVFGVLVSIASSSHGSGVLTPLIGILIAAWVFYMAFEAFHTASKRRNGIAVDEFSSIMDVQPTQGRFPIGAVILIGLGFILLLDTTDIIDIEQLTRFWPVAGQRTAESEAAKAEARR
jgi:TM2 domain-containing membrane protein YozV